MPRNKSLTKNAQMLRKNATKQENKLWHQFLKKHTIPFKRQVTFFSYIVDFYCPKAKLVVEIDGSQHYTSEALLYDRKRTEMIESSGCYVIRYTNADIDRRFESVCIDINKHLSECLERLYCKVRANNTSSTIADAITNKF